jgi:hypothetical protein
MLLQSGKLLVVLRGQFQPSLMCLLEAGVAEFLQLPLHSILAQHQVALQLIEVLQFALSFHQVVSEERVVEPAA